MAFQPSKSKKNLAKEDGSLNMNSMMDMMTIILLFLLKSFSTEGALVTASEELKLPVSSQVEKPQKEVSVSISRSVIMVNDQVIIPDLSQIPKDLMLIAPLANKLAEFAEMERQLEIDVGKEFTHKINIQGDEKLPFEILFKIMFTCSKSDFYKMRLVTVNNAS